MNVRLKKGLVTLLAVVMLVMSVPSLNVSAAVSELDKNEIKNVIKQYFDNEFESVKNGHAVNQDNIIGDLDLKELKTLKYERKALWHAGLGNKLSFYSNTINYDLIDGNEKECVVKLNKDTKFSFTKNPNIISEEFGIEHIIKLRKINNKWLIIRDIDKSDENYTEGAEGDLNLRSLNDFDPVVAEEIEVLEEDFKTLNEQIEEYKEFKAIVKENKEASERGEENNNGRAGRRYATASYAYNSKAAVAYARKWAYSKNPEYPNWIDKGTDCANFVSQCIYAGAPVMNASGKWYMGRLVYGVAWTTVDHQWKFLTTNTGKGPVAIDNSFYLDITNGDVINFWSRWTNNYSHTVIVTSLGEYGEVYFSAHTKARKDYALDDAYASGDYIQSKQRTAHIVGYNK